MRKSKEPNIIDDLFNEANERFKETLIRLGDNEPDFDTVEKNEMICRYMGGLYATKSGFWGIGNAKHGEGKLSGLVFAWEHYSPRQLKYHASYDWLMPVVREIAINNDAIPEMFSSLDLASPIHDIYDTVCEYLEKTFAS